MASRRYSKRQVLGMLDDSDQLSASESESEDSKPESDDYQTDVDSPVDGSDDESDDSSSVPSWPTVPDNDQPHTLPNFLQTLVFKSMLLQISKLHTSSKFIWTTIS